MAANFAPLRRARLPREAHLWKAIQEHVPGPSSGRVFVHPPARSGASPLVSVLSLKSTVDPVGDAVRRVHTRHSGLLNDETVDWLPNHAPAVGTGGDGGAAATWVAPDGSRTVHIYNEGKAEPAPMGALPNAAKVRFDVVDSTSGGMRTFCVDGVHGRVLADAWWGGLDVSPAGDAVLYVAEAGVGARANRALATTVPGEAAEEGKAAGWYAGKPWRGAAPPAADELAGSPGGQEGQQPPKAEEADKDKDATLMGADSLFADDWGELYTGLCSPGLFVASLRSGRAVPVPLPRGFTCGQASFSPDGNWVVFTAWPEQPRRLGSIFCFNRPCAVMAAPVKHLMAGLHKPSKDERPKLPKGVDDEIDPEDPRVAFRLSGCDVSPEGWPRTIATAMSARFSPDGARIATLATEDLRCHNGGKRVRVLAWSDWIGGAQAAVDAYAAAELERKRAEKAAEKEREAAKGGDAAAAAGQGGEASKKEEEEEKKKAKKSDEPGPVVVIDATAAAKPVPTPEGASPTPLPAPPAPIGEREVVPLVNRATAPDAFPGLYCGALSRRCWSADGRSIWAASARRSSLAVYRFDAATGVPELLEASAFFEPRGPVRTAARRLDPEAPLPTHFGGVDGVPADAREECAGTVRLLDIATHPAVPGERAHDTLLVAVSNPSTPWTICVVRVPCDGPISEASISPVDEPVRSPFSGGGAGRTAPLAEAEEDVAARVAGIRWATVRTSVPRARPVDRMAADEAAASAGEDADAGEEEEEQEVFTSTLVLPPAGVPAAPHLQDQWDAADGFEAEQAGAAVEGSELPPLIVWPHGGPHSMLPCMFTDIATFFATLGYAVLFPNYRGSLGHGEEGLRSLAGRAGSQDVSDCLAAVDTVHRIDPPVVRPGAMLASGGSHGGFLVTHFAGQHSDRFLAVAARNPVVNIANMWGVTDIKDWCAVEALGEAAYDPTTTPPVLSGEQYGRMLAVSPIAHVGRVQAPTLLMLGAEDRRVPALQALEYYHQLRARPDAPPARVTWHPKDSHPLSRPATDAGVWIHVARWFQAALRRGGPTNGDV